MFSAIVIEHRPRQFQPLSNVKDQLKPGDIIEFHRGLYSHYALYLGNGKVMNIDAEEKKAAEAKITVRALEEVCDSSNIRIRNHEDVAYHHFNRKPKPVDEIIRSAKSFENKTVSYQFDFQNCEYYSTFWRYGVGFSTQVARTKGTGGQLAEGMIRLTLGIPGDVFATDSFSNYIMGFGFEKYKNLLTVTVNMPLDRVFHVDLNGVIHFSGK